MRGRDEAPAAWRDSTLRRVIGWILILGTSIALGLVIKVFTVDEQLLRSPAFYGMLVGFGALVPFRWAPMTYRTRAVGFVVALGFSGWCALMNVGLAPGPLLTFCMVTIAAGIFLGRTALLVALAASAVGVFTAGLAQTTGLVPHADTPFSALTMAAWTRGAIHFLLVGGSVAALVHYVMAELERQESSVAERERLEALGRLAGGVAHDFNNALQIVFAWNELLSTHEDPEVREGVERIQTAANQAQRLTAQLLAVGRRDVWTLEEFDLARRVEHWLGATRRLVPEDFTVQLHVDGRPWVRCDGGQLEQILLNLVVNARDAIGSGGRIDIRVDEIAGDAAPGDVVTTTRAALMTVEDDGPGISASVLRHVFDPFFTTKGRAGSGLGLAIVHTAVRRAGGEIVVESRPGATKFSVFLPAIDATEARLLTPKPQRAPCDRVVLLAEDEEPIRAALTSSLREAGCTVLEAEDGTEAMKILDAYEGKIDVLCTDGVMPGTATRLVIDRYLELNPEGRVIVCSGHVEEELLRRKLRESHLELLPKPFAPSALLAKINSE